MTNGLELSLLGPLSIRVDDVELAVTQQRSRQLLALLGSRADAAWSWRELADQIWPDEPPGDPRQTIQVSISRLRTGLGSAADHLLTVPEGYLLADACVDALAFEQGVRRVQGAGAGPPAPVIAELEASLDLWRGDPLVDVEGAPALDRWAAELVALRTVADRLLVGAYSATGRLDEAIAVAGSLVERDRTDEGAACALATALVHRGNKSEALRVLEGLTAALRVGLGVSPSRPVLDLEREILQGTVELLAPRVDETHGTGFVARSDELDALVRADRPRLMRVVGNAGVGKSELLRAAAGRLRSDGAHVVTCEGSPVAGAPLEPIRSILAALERSGVLDDATIAAWATDTNDTGTRSPAPYNSRDELIEMMAAAVDNAVVVDGLHLMVDDAQWLDRTSQDVLLRIARCGRSWMTIFTRPDDTTAAFWNVVIDPAHTIQLRPFDTDEVLQFLKVNHPRMADARTAATLTRRSGGNPLFLTLIAQGVEEGTLTSGELPISLLMAAADRLAALPRQVRSCVEVAAVVGDEFELATVAAFDPDAAENLRVAARSGLVQLDGQSGSFVHGVIGDATRQLLPVVRRLDLHDAIGTLRRQMGAPASSYVHHFDETSELDPLRAARAHVAAGLEFAAIYDRDGALDHFQRADALLSRLAAPPPVDVATALFHLGSAERRLGRSDHVGHLTEAARIAKTAGERDIYFESVIELCGHGGASMVGQVDAEALELLTEALTESPPPELEARLCSAAATLLSFSPRGTQGRELFRAAWATARAVGDHDLEASVLMNAHLGLQDPTDVDERDRAVARLGELAGDDVDRRWESAFLVFTQSLIGGRGPELERSIVEMRRLHAVPKDRPKDFGMAFCESAYAVVHGRLDEADEHANRTLAIGASRYSSSWALATYGALVLSIKDAAGQVAAMGPTLEETLTHYPDVANIRSALALSYALQGERRKAVAVLHELLPGNQVRFDRDLTWSGSLSMLARAAVIVGDTTSMATILPGLSEWSGRMALMAVATLGPVDEALGMLAVGLGDLDGARRHAERARQVVDGLGAAIYHDRIDALDARIARQR